MRYASVCSGVEAASLAWGALGWEPVWFSEIEPFPCEVLKVRFPSVPNLGDMTKIKGKDYAGCVDLLVGGTPCQDLSVAGKRAGLAGERSSLAIDFVRLAYEMQCKWFVWENVPGCLSSGSNKGGDFATLLSLFTGRDVDVPKGGWCNSGFVRNTRPDRFGVAWRILDAQFTRTQSFPFAVPQRRRRVFVVGYFGDWRRAAEVLLEPDRLQWDTPARIKTREILAEIARADSALAGRALRGTGSGSTECFRSSNPGTFVQDECSGTIKVNVASAGNSSAGLITSLGESGKGFYNKQDFAQTLEAHEDKHRRNIVFWNGNDCAEALTCTSGRQLMPDKARLQCEIEQKTASGAKAGNIGYSEDVVPTQRTGSEIDLVMCFQQNTRDEVRYINGDGAIAGALAAESGMKQTNYICYENHAHDSRITESNEVSPLISSKAGTGGGNLPLVQECYAFEPGVAKREGGDSRFTENFCGTLRGNAGDNQHAVAIAENIIGRKVENGGNGVGVQEEIAYTQNATGVMGVCTSTVRRLLPVECERLMGFPDNWTRIPWRGKTEDECPDGPRYKACGNSMCVNVMQWIGEQIQKVEEDK